MGVVEEMLAAWRNAGVRLNPGASAEDLQRLEDALGAPLPSDLRAYFAIADGMREGEIDDDLGHFWSIEKILSEHIEREGRDARGAYRDLAFADVMVHSWYLWLRVRDGGLLSVFIEGSAEEHPSLGAVIEHLKR
jgi:cell wall assembly regulator SMI1